MLTDSEIAIIEKNVEAAKTLLDEIIHIAEGKDDTIVLFTDVKKNDLNMIVRSAKLKANVD